jgi:hypothetical protein
MIARREAGAPEACGVIGIRRLASGSARTSPSLWVRRTGWKAASRPSPADLPLAASQVDGHLNGELAELGVWNFVICL